MQALPWILDVGYTILAVALLVAVLGHILFGEFEVTMATLPRSIAGMPRPLPHDPMFGITQHTHLVLCSTCVVNATAPCRISAENLPKCF